MTIAINNRDLPENFPLVYREFIYETFKRIIRNNPEHQFVFISDGKQNQPVSIAKNVVTVVAGPATTSPLRWKYWFNLKVPSLLRKYNADVFVSCDGICSLSTKLPQCLVVHDLNFLQPEFFIKKSHRGFYKRNTQQFLNKAKQVITTSAMVKETIAAEYDIKNESVNVIHAGADENYLSIGEDERTIIKSSYTDGKEYFLYTGIISSFSNVLNLLKAFSVFKKRQQTGMKLVLAGKLSGDYLSFRKSLSSYKYRNDIVWLEDIASNELVQITAAAYAVIDISFYEGFNSSILQAVQCSVPVVITENSSMREYVADAALYADANDITTVADKMKLLYKDENLRKELIQKGSLIAGKYTRDKMADLFWQSICKAIE